MGVELIWTLVFNVMFLLLEILLGTGILLLRILVG